MVFLKRFFQEVVENTFFWKVMEIYGWLKFLIKTELKMNSEVQFCTGVQKYSLLEVCVFFEYVLISEYNLEIHLWLTHVCYSQVKNDKSIIF